MIDEDMSYLSIKKYNIKILKRPNVELHFAYIFCFAL